MDNHRVLVVGRHAPDFGDMPVTVVDQRDVLFPATSVACAPIVESLVEAAAGLDADLIFQNVPGQLAVALARRTPAPHTPRIGVVIAVPVQGEDGKPRGFTFDHVEWF